MLIAQEFHSKHRAILSDYTAALSIYTSKNFDIASADGHVRGIDRELNQLLTEITSYVDIYSKQEIANVKRNLAIFKFSFDAAFIALLAILGFLLIRLTGRLLKASLFDSATNLGNRAFFVLSIDKHLNRRDSLLFAILDVDEFKIINETCGNAGGDVYLYQIGQLVKDLMPARTEVFRLSGDIIGLILQKNENNHQNLEKLRLAISQYEFSWNDLSTSLTCSIGVYEPQHDKTEKSESVLNALYACMQEAKSTGRNKVVSFSREDKFIVARQQKMRMVSRVFNALEKKHIVLFRQAITPIDANKNGRYFEVLMRVKNNGNFDSPFPYLQAAERFHIITKLDRYIISETANYLNSHLEDKTNYSINLSGQSLSDPALSTFLDQLFIDAKN